MSTQREELIRKYAREAGSIYEARTAGDHTWVGVMVSLVVELENAGFVQVPSEPDDEMVEVFKAAWESADRGGMAGDRSATGLTAVLRLLADRAKAGA